MEEKTAKWIVRGYAILIALSTLFFGFLQYYSFLVINRTVTSDVVKFSFSPTSYYFYILLLLLVMSILAAYGLLRFFSWVRVLSSLVLVVFFVEYSRTVLIALVGIAFMSYSGTSAILAWLFVLLLLVAGIACLVGPFILYLQKDVKALFAPPQPPVEVKG